MLPSTGYFKGLVCPFYDSGLCERPYCHFRHVKKEAQEPTSDGVESGAILQKLVSAAVQKVLRQSDTPGSSSPISSTGEDTLESANKVENVQPSSSKATYNPTPISELKKINSVELFDDFSDKNDQKKKHIPVPYTPRKPANIPTKRTVDVNGSSKPFIYIPPPMKYMPGASDTTQLDQYTPKGSTESKEEYVPGIESELPEYTPKENQVPVKRNYVPSDRITNKKKVLEYRPTKVNTKVETSIVTYQPTPRSLAPCFSSDEEEVAPKKAKVTSDLNSFDDLGPEFDILDQILDEEKPKQDLEVKTTNCLEIISEVKDVNSKHNEDKQDVTPLDSNKTEKTKSEKHKSSSLDKHKNKSSSLDKHKNKSSHNDKKHKRKDKSREKSREKDSYRKKKKHSSSKDKDGNSKDHSSKHSEKKLKYSSTTSSHRTKSKDSVKKSTKDNKKEKGKHTISKNENIADFDDGNTFINDEEVLDISESDEETIALECKRIFEEYVPQEKIIDEEQNTNHMEENHDDEYIPVKKRISRTTEKNIQILPKPPVKPNFKVSAAQTMAQRLSKIREYHTSKIANEPTTTNPTKCIISNVSKIRIAHVPYASTLLNAKKTIKNTSNENKIEPSTSSTIIQTVKKGSQRVAHVPNEKFIDRPGVLEPLASKIPANIRSTYLNMMIDECIKIYTSATDAYARAQHEELTTSKKCSTTQIYKNSAVLTVSRLRKELQECNGIKKSGPDCLIQHNTQNSQSSTKSAASWSIISKNRRVSDNTLEFRGAKFYKNIQKWILTEQELQENGFPRPHTSGEKGRATIYIKNKQKPPKGFIRMCSRCKKDFTVDKKGFPAVKEDCIYHPNNKYRVRGETKYQCCSQDGTSDGCCIASAHVYDYIDFENLKGYVRTMPPESEKEDYGVYSLDCEMCYTTHGLDLTRITVINSDCKVVYETLVKPLHPIIDYNTRYSGITEEQMAKVRTTLLEVQATLLSMFNSKSILIGHSLESDFKALKLIHDTVIDTSVLFPHKMGPPYKRALRNLSSEHLKKIIQNSVEGHDSAEDATVCMELVIYKLKEDLKTR